MHKITSLRQLLDTLPSCQAKDYVKLARRMDIPISDFEPFMHWSKDHYTRNCIAKSDDYELILLCWEEGQETPIHCHSGQECWVHVLTGEISESRFHFNDEESSMEVDHSMVMSAGKLSYMNDEMGFHNLVNISDGRSMSLHLYMNPISNCRVYNSATGELELKRLEYHSLNGKVLETANIS